MASVELKLRNTIGLDLNSKEDWTGRESRAVARQRQRQQGGTFVPGGQKAEPASSS
jgi:hypothetical protein